jgi:hypothetical protein
VAIGSNKAARQDSGEAGTNDKREIADSGAGSRGVLNRLKIDGEIVDKTEERASKEEDIAACYDGSPLLEEATLKKSLVALEILICNEADD